MDFALILFILTCVTGTAWLADRLLLETKRAPGVREPIWVEYAKSFFPVLLVVFLLRSFLAEPFKIPSSSMRPTLEVGDFILVNKFIYGIRLPIIEQKIIPVHDPQRGDVVVFRYPLNPSQDFIKRVIGVSGDVVEYRDKKLTVNGVAWPQQSDGSYSYLEGLRFDTLERATELTDAERGESAFDRHQCRRPTGVRRERQGVPGARELRLQCARLQVQSACRRVFHDGRQPGQQRRQPILGLRPRRQPARQGVPDLVQLGRYRVV